ncbi:MAG: hypothetical protein II984_10135 [Clostridia bacterium]|nr:hypothetical protein [Clostridia bacterium]
MMQRGGGVFETRGCLLLHEFVLLGFSDGYDEWLNYYLETESPLSDIVLELSMCGSDVNKTISLLHSYCVEQNFDKMISHDKLRLFFKNAYYSNRMSKKEVLSAMYRLSLNIGEHGDFDGELWRSMHYLDYYYDLTLDGIIPMENFDFAFFSYLDNGTPLDSDLIWRKNTKRKPSLLDKIKSFFK